METPKETVIVKYSSYTEAQKKATQKYRDNNKEKVNEQRKKYYNDRKESDPQFLEYKRTKAKEYYLRKKQSDSDESIESDRELTVEQIIDIIPEPIPSINEEIISEPVPTIEPPKKKRRCIKRTTSVPDIDLLHII